MRTGRKGKARRRREGNGDEIGGKQRRKLAKERNRRGNEMG